MSNPVSIASVLVALGLMICLANPVDAQGTRMLRDPDVGPNHIVFVHANDIWLVGRDGGDAIRLTSSEGAETDPVFSPDGRWIAFTGQYGGAKRLVRPAEKSPL